jgi:hypothetical protein
LLRRLLDDYDACLARASAPLIIFGRRKCP